MFKKNIFSVLRLKVELSEWGCWALLPIGAANSDVLRAFFWVISRRLNFV